MSFVDARCAIFTLSCFACIKFILASNTGVIFWTCTIETRAKISATATMHAYSSIKKMIEVLQLSNRFRWDMEFDTYMDLQRIVLVQLHTVCHRFLLDTRRNSLGIDWYSLHHFYMLPPNTFPLLFHSFVPSSHLRIHIRMSQCDRCTCHCSSMDCICNRQCFLSKNGIFEFTFGIRI